MSNNSMIDDLIANDPEMLESFINESRECLAAAEKDLKNLRDVPGEPDPESIERAFRSIHSLKSAAGFLGLDTVSKLALRMEEMIGDLRGGIIAPDVKRLDLLLEGVGMIEDMLAKPMDSSDVDTGAFLEKVAAYRASHHGE